MRGEEKRYVAINDRKCFMFGTYKNVFVWVILDDECQKKKEKKNDSPFVGTNSLACRPSDFNTFNKVVLFMILWG